MGPGKMCANANEPRTEDWHDIVDAWTPDSKAIFFSTKRTGRWTILEQDINAQKPETLIGVRRTISAPN
jgi:Tol biopolymer transport system component